MKDLATLAAEEKRALRAQLDSRVEGFRAQKLDLDMTRGKPGADQLDLANGLLAAVDGDSFKTPSGLDTRNYGGLDGFDEAKALFAQYLGVGPSQLVIGGNSSLALMHDCMSQLVTHGAAGVGRPWTGGKARFICPVPGYDRHFTICQRFGIEMVNVDMTDRGPDMDQVEELASADPAVKGMWCVPRYSNPTGATCSAEVVQRLARMKTAAADFRIFWDDAYAVHHLGSGPAPLKSLLEACTRAGNAERVLIFGSTSKVSFSGAGVALMGGSEATCAWARERLFVQTIGPDKVNILRHLVFYKDMDGILAHMQKHAAILAPKFKAVDSILSRELGGAGVATWTRPTGGYFISLDTLDGMASAVIKKAAELGVKLTPAGSTFPYKKDPRDRNIRIAPTFPGLPALQKATEVLAVCILAVAVAKGV